MRAADRRHRSAKAWSILGQRRSTRIVQVVVVLTLACILQLLLPAVSSSVGETTASAASPASGWSIAPAPSQPVATDDGVDALSCLSLTFCMGAWDGSNGTGATIETWNPSTSGGWVATNLPGSVASASISQLYCDTSTDCFAFGTEGTGDLTGLAARWDGSAWTILPQLFASEGSEITQASCSSSTFCMAIGSPGSNDQPAAEIWNGSAWTEIAPPDGIIGETEDLSCVSSTFCAYIPDFYTGTEIEIWNGSTWTSYTVPSERLSRNFMQRVEVGWVR